MTMLEKMTRAICLEYHKGCGFDLDGAQAETDILWPEWIGEARAALLAIREPNDAMLRAYYEAEHPATDTPAGGFTRWATWEEGGHLRAESMAKGHAALIDAMLAEGASDPAPPPSGEGEG